MTRGSPLPPDAPESALAALLRRAGARPAIEDERRDRVERAVRAAWRAALRRRRRRRWVLALAAMVSAIAILATMRALPPPAAEEVAIVLHASGPVFRVRGSDRVALQVGDRLDAGDWLETGDGGFANLGIEALQSLRLDRSSRLEMRSARHFHLARGGAYFDSGAQDGGIEVTTPLLRATDVGTRFQVRHEGDGSVAVREGIVDVAGRGSIRHRIEAGQRLALTREGRSERQTLAPHAPDWDWTRSAAAPFAADGRPLRELLHWYAMEHGYALQIDAGSALQQRLSQTLQGDLEGLDGEALLDIARAAGPLQVVVDREQGAIRVRQ